MSPFLPVDRSLDMRRSHYLGLAFTGFLAMTTIAAPANQADEFVQFQRFTGSCDGCFAYVGDLIELPFETDSTTGPTGLKVEVSNKEVFPRKPIIALTVPDPFDVVKPGGVIPPVEIRAYLTAEGIGDAVVRVTPRIPAGGRKVEPRVFRIKVLKRGDPPPGLQGKP